MKRLGKLIVLVTLGALARLGYAAYRQQRRDRTRGGVSPATGSATTTLGHGAPFDPSRVQGISDVDPVPLSTVVEAVDPDALDAAHQGDGRSR